MWATPEESCAGIVAAFRRAADAAARTIDELELDATGKHHSGLTVSLRWMILNVLEDTIRHAGHADIIRESIDGRVGLNDVIPNVQSSEDEEYYRRYLARMAGEISGEEWMAFNRSRPDYDPEAWPRFLRTAWGPDHPALRQRLSGGDAS